MSESPFRGAVVRNLAIAGAISFALALAIAVMGPDWTDIDSDRADTYSRSAIGHRALVETLRRLHVPVVVSRHGSATKAGADAVLVVAEPGGGAVESGDLREMIQETSAAGVLVVLPRWDGDPHPEKPGWIARVSPVADDEIDAVLQAVGAGGGVQRRAPPAAWDAGDLPAPDLRAPQVAVGSDLEPVIDDGRGGVLLGLVPGSEPPVWVLADPDLIANHGIGRGDNALLALRILFALREHGGVVIDETLHGYEATPSIWRALFEMPLLLATLQAALVLGLLLWAAARRFGAPEPLRPALGRGRAVLVENTAALLAFGGHAAHALERYWRSMAREVAAGLHAPDDLDEAARVRWLERAGRVRGVEESATEIDEMVRRADGRRSLAVARRIHRWRTRMLGAGR